MISHSTNLMPVSSSPCWQEREKKERKDKWKKKWSEDTAGINQMEIAGPSERMCG